MTNTSYLGTVRDYASARPIRPATAQELLHSALAGDTGAFVDTDGRIVYVERGGREGDVIDALAHICATEALSHGAESRALRPDEDAGLGDYDALEAALGRSLTGADRAAFRAAYSAALSERGAL